MAFRSSFFCVFSQRRKKTQEASVGGGVLLEALVGQFVYFLKKAIKKFWVLSNIFIFINMFVEIVIVCRSFQNIGNSLTILPKVLTPCLGGGI